MLQAILVLKLELLHDASGNTDTATRTVTVVDTTAPVINTASIVGNVYEGETALGSVSANESVTWSVSGSGVSISSSGVITLDNPADYESATSHSFTVTATDTSNNITTSSTIIVSVIDTNENTINITSASTWNVSNVGSIYTVTTDASENFSCSISNTSSNRIAVNNCNVRITGNYRQSSGTTYTFTLTVTGSTTGATSSQQVTINVN